MLRDEVLRESEPLGRDAAGGSVLHDTNDMLEDSLDSREEVPQRQRAVAVLLPQQGDGREDWQRIVCRVDFIRDTSANPCVHVLLSRAIGFAFESDWLALHCRVVIQ